MTTVNPDKYGQGGGSRDGIRKHSQVVSSRVKYDEVYESIVSLVKYGDGGTGSVKSVKYGKKLSCIANLNTLAFTKSNQIQPNPMLLESNHYQITPFVNTSN